jgi:hypothetical protein
MVYKYGLCKNVPDIWAERDNWLAKSL